MRGARERATVPSHWLTRESRKCRLSQGAELGGTRPRCPRIPQSLQNAPWLVPQVGSQIAGIGRQDALGNLEVGACLQESMAVAVPEPVVGGESPVVPIGARTPGTAVKACKGTVWRPSTIWGVEVWRVAPRGNPTDMSRTPVPVHRPWGVPVTWIPDPAYAAGVAPGAVVIGDPSPGFGGDPGQSDWSVDPPAGVIRPPSPCDMRSPDMRASIPHPTSVALERGGGVGQGG